MQSKDSQPAWMTSHDGALFDGAGGSSSAMCLAIIVLLAGLALIGWLLTLIARP